MEDISPKPMKFSKQLWQELLEENLEQITKEYLGEFREEIREVNLLDELLLKHPMSREILGVPSQWNSEKFSVELP